jgi:hypothetical protein
VSRWWGTSISARMIHDETPNWFGNVRIDVTEHWPGCS